MFIMYSIDEYSFMQKEYLWNLLYMTKKNPNFDLDFATVGIAGIAPLPSQ